jgi:serine/threonine-protein kinase
VIRHDPSRDRFVDPGTAIDLVVSTGRPEVAVPYVIGVSLEQARSDLRGRDLRVRAEEVESDEPAGIVIRTDPPPGEMVATNTRITVYYSAGPNEVPDVVGMKRAAAEREITEAGFRPEVVDDTTSTEPKGTVTRQSPGSGETLPQNSTVVIYVSVYEEPEETEEPTPDPTDTSTPDPGNGDGGGDGNGGGNGDGGNGPFGRRSFG